MDRPEFDRDYIQGCQEEMKFFIFKAQREWQKVTDILEEQLHYILLDMKSKKIPSVRSTLYGVFQFDDPHPDDRVVWCKLPHIKVADEHGNMLPYDIQDIPYEHRPDFIDFVQYLYYNRRWNA